MNHKQFRELAALRAGFTSLEEMAAALRGHPGFMDLHRATLSRWMRRPSPRAAVAIQVLKSRRSAVRLRIAQPETLSLIPSWMLTWEPEEGKPHGLLERRFGVAAQVQPSRHGGPALDLLMKGKTDIAAIPGDMLPQLGRGCRRLCLLSKLYVSGIATRPIEAVLDLKGKTFGIVAGSAFATRLSEVARTWGVALPAPLIFASPRDIAQALLAGKVHGIVGSEPSVSHVRRAVGRSLQTSPIREGLLGWFEMHLAVNLRTAPPSAVRAYLAGLLETTRYANARRTVAAFQAEIAARFDMDQSDVRQVLGDTVFSVGDFDPATILALWEREVVDLRKTH